MLHPRFGTRARAIALQATLASLMVAFGTFGEIVAYFLLATVLFLALTVVAAVRLRRSRPALAGARIPLHPLAAAVFLALVAVVSVLLAAGRPKESLIGVAVVLLGLPLYGAVSSKDRSPVP